MHARVRFGSVFIPALDTHHAKQGFDDEAVDTMLVEVMIDHIVKGPYGITYMQQQQ
jgi:hypothetical protein